MGLNKISYIKQLNNGKWRVYSKSGKNMGTYDSKSDAESRLKDIEMFKHINADDVLYSAIELETTVKLSGWSEIGNTAVSGLCEAISSIEDYLITSANKKDSRKDKNDAKHKGNKWKKMPKGWTSKSRKEYYQSIGGFDECLKDMKGKMEDPGAFCASLKDRVQGKGWRKKKRKKK